VTGFLATADRTAGVLAGAFLTAGAAVAFFAGAGAGPSAQASAAMARAAAKVGSFRMISEIVYQDAKTKTACPEVNPARYHSITG
jgi:hypothetical protein